VLRTYGIKGLQDHIRKHIKLGEIFAGLLEKRKDIFEIVTGPNFALTVFNIVPKVAGKMEQDQLTKEVYELVNSRGEIFITSSVIGGVYVIRVVSANPLADEKNIRRAFEILVETAEEIRDGKVMNERSMGL
jgi:aromatic-L-amino-acid decarboxylase